MTDFAATVKSVYETMFESGEITLAPDNLPYTDEFESFFKAVKEAADSVPTKREVYKTLISIRKQGRLRTGKRQDKVDPTGLLLAQRRILKALGENPTGLSREEIAARADTEVTVALVGPTVREQIAESEERYGKKSLLGMRLISVQVIDVDGVDTPVYKITKTGTKLLAKISGATVNA